MIKENHLSPKGNTFSFLRGWKQGAATSQCCKNAATPSGQNARSAGAAPAPALSGAWQPCAPPYPPTPLSAHARNLCSPLLPRPPTRTCAFAPLTLRLRARALENSTPKLAPPSAPSLRTPALKWQAPSQQPLREQNGSLHAAGFVLFIQSFGLVVSAGG